MNKYSRRFDDNIEALRAYAAAHGTCAVPHTFRHRFPDGSSILLGRWITYLRGRRALDALSADRIAALEAIPGWSWEPRTPGPKGEVARNREIRTLRAAGATLGSLAETYGLSRQRIHQIVSDPR